MPRAVRRSRRSVEAVGNQSRREPTPMLTELRSLQRDPGSTARQPSQLAKLVERMRNLEASARDSDRTEEFAVLEEATLAALSIGAEIQPEVYAQEHGQYSDRLSDRAAGGGLERASLRRVLDVLAAEVGVPQQRDYVALHAATYPSCDMNVDFLVTITRQLTDQDRFAEAIELARDGLELCARHPAVNRLSDELR